MCPALILAANRNDRVKGRTNTLVVSIRTKNGFSQSGAPSGRKWAVDFLGLCENLDIINLIQIGRPKVSVKIKCLEVLKVYGINPIRFTIISKKKMEDKVVDMPFKWRPEVRDSCVKIVCFTGDLNLVDREFITQNEDWIISKIRVFVTRNMEFVGNKVLNI